MMKPNIPSKWDETKDVIVIGSGFAGLAAAIEAKNAGSSVIIIEKMKGYGGNSAISDGVIAAAGTSMQAEAGIEDSADRMCQDMLKAGLGLNQPELVQMVAEQSNAVFQWSIEYLGVKYQDRVDQFGGHSVPRCYTPHRRSGLTILKQMLAKAKELGLRIRTRGLLHQFLVDSEGRVQGVEVREGYTYPDADSGIPKSIKAQKAVILATGGFGNDVQFRSSQDPRLTRDVGTTNKHSTKAEALVAALRIGALPVHLSWIQLGPWACADEKGYGIGPDFASYIALPYGILINPATGTRFVNELGDRKVRADAILNVGHPCIAIADAKGVSNSGHQIEHCLHKGVVKAFATINEVSSYYDIAMHPLTKSIKQFNRHVANNLDKDFNKPILSNAAPIDAPPYYCIRLWPKVHYTMGGVLINTKAQVMDLSNQPVPSLYAAGEVTGGVHGACRLGSCAITDCLVFGRIAGKNAALEIPA